MHASNVTQCTTLAVQTEGVVKVTVTKTHAFELNAGDQVGELYTDSSPLIV